jgi:hypothetical protein
MMTMRTSPRLEDIWELHWSYTAGIEQNSAGVFVANVDDPATIAAALTAPPRGSGPARGAAAPSAAPGQPPAAGAQPAMPSSAGQGRGSAAASHTPAYWIKITARPDGSFTVSNSRNNFSKTYGPRLASTRRQTGH